MTLSADELKELRAKAEAAIALAPKEDWYADHDLTRTGGPGLLHEDAAFIAALNPATALSLIQAAELNAELVGALEKARDHYDMLVRIANGSAVYEIEKSSGKRVRRKLSYVLACEADAGSRHCRQALSKAKGSAGHD